MCELIICCLDMSEKTTFEAKARKGRCPGFPGYCHETIATCEYAHPIVDCEKFPRCFKTCTFLHPICEHDCLRTICPDSKCIKFHPWKDS